MREILFRGKAVNLHNGSKDFVYGQYVQNRDGKMIYSDTWEDGIQKHYVIEKTVGQYTGLTDKNGTKIFEGDIVKDEYGCVGVVEFGEGTFDSGIYRYYGWHTKDKCGKVDHNELYIYDEYNFFEIIGNIHDNPELLKGGVQE